jgi:hypothetical protein
MDFITRAERARGDMVAVINLVAVTTAKQEAE